MFKLDLDKAEELGSNCQHPLDHRESNSEIAFIKKGISIPFIEKGISIPFIEKGISEKHLLQ